MIAAFKASFKASASVDLLPPPAGRAGFMAAHQLWLGLRQRERGAPSRAPSLRANLSPLRRLHSAECGEAGLSERGLPPPTHSAGARAIPRAPRKIEGSGRACAFRTRSVRYLLKRSKGFFFWRILLIFLSIGNRERVPLNGLLNKCRSTSKISHELHRD